ncbi:class I SAM-dependent methyltransferase [Thiospirillum jenense]|uniref:SAM-dependent methyltransferase n=1 Tax=Thiospirillum jenense TaxID=1653858 RepID=UPI0030B84963
MDSETDYIAALIELHRGLKRQGPGDDEFSRHLLQELAAYLPVNPRIADLGCGSGAASLLLANDYHSRVLAVDLSAEFIAELSTRAQAAGLADFITPINADMADLNWPNESIDLLWSEGAAYQLGFENALTRWRPLIRSGGIAVISEMSWFIDDAPPPAQTYWQTAYPTMANELDNMARAKRAGFHVLITRRLPSAAWWANYYEPLKIRIQQLNSESSLAPVLRETEQEMALFAQYSDHYGYTFYVLQAC